jgi:hypothetical protein
VKKKIKKMKANMVKILIDFLKLKRKPLNRWKNLKYLQLSLKKLEEDQPVHLFVRSTEKMTKTICLKMIGAVPKTSHLALLTYLKEVILNIKRYMRKSYKLRMIRMSIMMKRKIPWNTCE